jgi:cytochrome c biogenesis protein CcmG, thiol:disulfide interchange protein DsbE
VAGPAEPNELGEDSGNVPPRDPPTTLSPATNRRRPKLRLVGTLLLLALLISAIVSAVEYSNTASEASNKGATTIGFVRLGNTKPASFDLSELMDPGVSESLANYVGKPLLLNFWSSTCTICAQEAPAMVSAYHQLGAQIEFVGIDTAEPSRGSGVSFATLHAMTYPLLFDGSAAVASRYDVPGLPVSFFISRTGKVLGENFGALTVSSIDHLVHMLYGISPSQ